MTKEIQTKIKKFLNDYAAVIPFGLTILPVLIAGLIVLIYARGDTALANYVIQQTGIVDIWTQGLIVAISSLFQGFLILLVLVTIVNYKKWTEWKLVLIILGITAILQITPILMLLVVSGTFILFVFLHFLRHRRKFFDYTISLQWDAYIVSIVSLIGIAFPSIPTTILTLHDNTKKEALVLVRKDSFYLVQETKTQKVSQIQKSNIKDEKICKKNSSFWFRPVFEAAFNVPTRLDDC